MNIEGDYTEEQVRDATLVMEQLVRYEKDKPYEKEMKVALHILRAVNRIGEGTWWLTKRAEV